jgi:hypothetical protein
MAAKKKTTIKRAEAKKTTETKTTDTKRGLFASWKSDLKKNPRKKWTYIILVVIVAVGILAYYKANYFIAATVNGEPITRYALVVELEKQGAQQVLEQMVTNKLILQKAKEAGIEVTQEEMDKEIARIEESLVAQGADLETMLSFYNQTKESFMDGVKQNLLIKELMKDKVEVTDSDIEEYFNSNTSEFPEGSTLDDLKEQIYNTLYDNEVGMAYQEWLQETKNSSNVKYYIYFPSN